ncbi:MAG: hypothetical protein WBN88_07510, partial [Anderseniella sp.]
VDSSLRWNDGGTNSYSGSENGLSEAKKAVRPELKNGPNEVRKAVRPAKMISQFTQYPTC